MKISVKNAVPSDSIKFLILTEKELSKAIDKQFFYHKAIKWQKETFIIEGANLIKNEKIVDLQIVEPDDEIELTKILVKAFVEQGGSSESDLISLMAIFNRMQISEVTFMNEMILTFGKSFAKLIDFYRWTLDLSDEIKNTFKLKGLSLKVFYYFRNESFELLTFFINVIREFDLNSNSLKNMINYTVEIAKRDKILFSDVFEKTGLSEVLEMDISEKEKFKIFMENLYQIRYPVWSNKRKNLKKRSDQFFSKTGVSLSLPDFVEGNEVEVKFTVKSQKDFLRKLNKMRDEEVLIQEIIDEMGS